MNILRGFCDKRGMRLPVAVFGLPFLAACPQNDSSAIQAEEFTLSDQVVMARVYDSSYSVPSIFFVDERADTPGSYTTYHVKDISNSYELCTDDYAQALEWEAADNLRRQANGVFVDSVERGKYFEVIRELSHPDSIGNIPGPTTPGFSRVFKCSYVYRNGADRNLRNGYAGTLNFRPLSESEVREFVEYLWQFTFFWPASKSVLASYTDEAQGNIRHTLVLGLLTNQGNDRCDLIEVVDWTFTVSRRSGEVEKAFVLRRAFEAQLVNGTPRHCSM